MKFLVTTHEQHLKNMQAHLERQWERVESLKKDAIRMEAGCLKLEQQIAEAKRRGMDGFDAERFMKTRK